MTTRIFYPALVAGVWPAMPSKSMAHRVLFASLLSPSPTRIGCPFKSVDMLATADVVARLGAKVESLEDGWLIEGGGACRRFNTPHPQVVDLYPQESGTTLRYGMSVVASLGVEARWHLCPGLQRRPLAPLDETLSTLGVRVSKLDDGYHVGAWPSVECTAMEASMSGAVSSQFIGGLMMAFGARPGRHRLSVIPPFESQPYIAMTMDVMRTFGITLERCDTYTFEIEGQALWTSPGSVMIEGDWSNSALAFVVGVIQREGRLVITGLDDTTRQGDRAIVEMLRTMGGQIHKIEGGYGVEASALKGAMFDCTHTPDLVPVLAVACAAAQGQSVIRGAARLRMKESDRLSTVCDLLRKLGVVVRELEDGLVIEGQALHRREASFHPTTEAFEGYQDHRLVMATLAASTRLAHPIEVSGSEAITKSYPHLWTDWARLGGCVKKLTQGV